MNKFSISRFKAFSWLLVGFFTACTPKTVTDSAIEAKIKAMTLDEKLAFIGGYNEFNIRGYEHLAIPEVRMADGPVGVRNYGPSTAYPASINLAASWDKNMAYNIGKAIGIEARAQNVHIMLGPGMNIYRMPLCGRNFEYLGEDPFLASQMAKGYIVGMQDQGVMACAKHYAANNQEFDRHHVSSDLDERTLHEIYLPAFKTAVTEANVAAVMTSYNLINRIHASEHDYLNNKVLKGDWNFKGFVMSDWVSTYNGLGCALGGLDIEMPSGKLMNPDTLKLAISQGKLSEEVINDKIRRILTTYKRFNLFENPNISKNYIADTNFVRKASLEAARGGMVLLKNENNLLPIDSKNLRTIAIIGPNAKKVAAGGGSSTVRPLHSIDLVQAIEKVAGKNVNVTYAQGVSTGVDLPEGIFDAGDFMAQHQGKSLKGFEANYYLNKNLEGNPAHSTVVPKLNLNHKELKYEGCPDYDFSVSFKSTFTPTDDKYYVFGVSGDDGYRLLIDGQKVVDQWSDHGEMTDKYVSQLKKGKTYHIELQYYQSGGDATIKFGVKALQGNPDKMDYLAQAIEVAQKADLVVMAVGFNAGTESEGSDRSFDLPYNQSKLINAVANVNKNMVVVLNAGGNLEMESWIHNANALLMAWFPGQEGNMAAAEILFGITNPSGKLPASFEQKLEDNPAYPYYWDTDNDKRVNYGEGIYVGYRFYDKGHVKPRFPFGYGLSYTTFAYSNLTTDKPFYAKDEKVMVTIEITNTGSLDGAEVVQLYVADPESALPRPVKELKAFDKVHLKVGETKKVEFSLDANAFSYYNPDKHAWVLEPGQFKIHVGSSSADIRQTAEINIQ